MPLSWQAVLKATRGVYLLAYPRTGEHYVGSAYGDDGFLGRWNEYAATGHGGNAGRRSRDPSDYLVSILEVAGSNMSAEEITPRGQANLVEKLFRDAKALNIVERTGQIHRVIMGRSLVGLPR